MERVKPCHFGRLKDHAILGSFDSRENRRTGVGAGHVEVDQVAEVLDDAEPFGGILTAEYQQRASDANLVTVLQQRRTVDTLTVEKRSVGAIQIGENPCAVAGTNLRVPA